MSIQHFYSQTVADGTATSVVRPSDWNSNHKMVYNLSGNTLGSSQISGSDVIFQAGNNVTLSADTANSKLVFSAAAGGGGGVTASFMEPNMLVGTAYSSFGQNTLYFLPVKPAMDVTMTAVNMFISLNNATSNNSHAVSQTIQYGWYSLGTGASSTQIGLMQSSSIAIIASYSSANSGGYTISQGATSTTYSSAGTGSTSAWTGQRIFAMPMATLLSEGGEYYFMMKQNTTSVGNTGALRMSHLVLNNMTNGSFGRLAPTGVTVSNSSVIPNYNGFIYSATSNAPPATFPVDARRIVSNIRMYIQLDA
jgi:hypothetical protein